MKWVTYQRRWEETRERGREKGTEREREGRLCFYRRQCCEAMKPFIDKRGLSYSAHHRTLNWRSLRLDGTTVDVFTNCLLPKQNFSLSSSFPFHPPFSYIWSLSLFCLLLPRLFFLLLFSTCAAEGFALGDLLCGLNYMQQIWNIYKKKCEQNCVCFIDILAAEEIFYLIQRDLEMHLLNKGQRGTDCSPATESAA